MNSKTPTPSSPSRPRTSYLRPNLTQRPLSSSNNSTTGTATTTATTTINPKKEKRHSVLTSLRKWVSTSEPSADAWKKHTRDTHKNAGVSLRDPLAGAKMHLPGRRIPAEAIKPSGSGPDPEEIVLRKAEEAAAARAYAHSASSSRYPSGLTLHKLGSRASHPGSSHSSESYASTLGTLFDKPH